MKGVFKQLDNNIKYKVSGTVVGQYGVLFDEPIPFLSSSAAENNADAVEGVKKSFDKMDLMMGPHITVTMLKDYRRIKEAAENIRTTHTSKRR